MFEQRTEIESSFPSSNKGDTPVISQTKSSYLSLPYSWGVTLDNELRGNTSEFLRQNLRHIIYKSIDLGWNMLKEKAKMA